MNGSRAIPNALTTPNQFIEKNGRTLAYRSLGAGTPVVLCTRFRGNMDVWDPAFLDALAGQGFRVITFDYSGLGLSLGKPTYNPLEMAKDVADLIDALGLEKLVIAGWSLGGLVAQVALAMYAPRFSHAVLIGTSPPGSLVKVAEQLFYDTASLPEYGFEEEVVLFFEPKSERSRRAARRSVDRIAMRTFEPSKPIAIAFAVENLGSGPKNPVFPADAVLTFLKTTQIPILHLAGDHDIIFPVENWYALNQQLPTLQLVTYPGTGHGPHHEYPEASAEHIAAFVRSTP